MRRILFVLGVSLFVSSPVLYITAIPRQSYLLIALGAFAQGAAQITLLATKFSSGYIWKPVEKFMYPFRAINDFE